MVPSPCKGAKKNHGNKYPAILQIIYEKKRFVGCQGTEGSNEVCLGMSTSSMSCQNMVTYSGSLVTVRFMGSEDADALASKGPSSPFN
jgi:hypothetical protein